MDILPDLDPAAEAAARLHARAADFEALGQHDTAAQLRKRALQLLNGNRQWLGDDDIPPVSPAPEDPAEGAVVENDAASIGWIIGLVVIVCLLIVTVGGLVAWQIGLWLWHHPSALALISACAAAAIVGSVLRSAMERKP
jgi:hypothetical protein